VSKSRPTATLPLPHSWAIEAWPQHVYPGSPGKGRYLVRCNRTSLTAAGALTRIGRDLVIIGGPYSAWLASQSSRVDSFTIAPNNRPPADQAAA